jgi:hypothetical protein
LVALRLKDAVEHLWEFVASRNIFVGHIVTMTLSCYEDAFSLFTEPGQCEFDVDWNVLATFPPACQDLRWI